VTGADSRFHVVMAPGQSIRHVRREPELFVCGIRGHELPGAGLANVDERHAGIARETVDGQRLVRCLRCGDWVLVAPPPTGTTIDDVDAIPRPSRGRALRDAFVLRIIAIDRVFHTVAFAAVGVAAVAIDRNIAGVHGWANSLLNDLNNSQQGSGGASSHGILTALLTRLANLKPHSLKLLAAFAFVYAAISAAEATGLWLQKRWAEYLTAVATAIFLPLEIHELVKRVTFVRVLAFAVNLGILVYLVWAKHLFGIGGKRRETNEPLSLDPLPDLEPIKQVP
jgi:uncharacterized membrane protein (DUF2068 family)